MGEQTEVQKHKEYAMLFWNLRFYFRKFIFHRILAPYIGAPIFYLSYFILPLITAILILNPLFKLSLDFNFIKYLHNHFNYEIIGILFIYSISVYFLFFYFLIIRYPRSPKRKIGIGVAFAYDFIKELGKLKDALRYRDDVIRELEKIIDQEKFSHVFKIIKLNDYHANRFFKKFSDKKLAYKYLKKTRIIFTIFGYVKNGKYENENKYKYELEYFVGHSLIPTNICGQMSKKFSHQLKSQKWEFEESNFGYMSEGVAENIRENAYFAIGVSSFYSNNPQIAVIFLDKLLNSEIERPDLLLDIKAYLARSHFYIGRIITVNRAEEKWLNIAIREVELSVFHKPNYYMAYILLCYLYYKNKDIDKAFIAIDKAQKYQEDAVWRFSKAFLHFYKGGEVNFKTGLDVYKSLKKKRLIPINQTVFRNEIIPSLLEVIEKEQKNQFYYPLIFVYSKALDDRQKATEYFNLFSEKEKNNPEMKILIEEARSII